jgi:squalene cyclase
MALDSSVRSDFECELLRRQMANGAWAYFHGSDQADFEATALAAMAIRNQHCKNEAVEYLLQMQNRNGSWPAFAGDDDAGSWTTSLAVLALRGPFNSIEARTRGVRWLLATAGRESHWIWQLKYRLFESHFKLDASKYGWPWNPDTTSWVVPTAAGVLALKSLPCECGFPGYSFRLERAVAMLLARACPAGGWNSGNSVVYGSALIPHADDTAMALLALREKRDDPVVKSAIDWLALQSLSLPPSASLAMSIIALSVHGRSTTHLLQSLLRSHSSSFTNAATLALVILALDAANEPSIFVEAP